MSTPDPAQGPAHRHAEAAHGGSDPVETDVVVVGLGPGGEFLANKLARAGLDVVAVDKHLVGGECPFYGCVPSKIMTRGSHVLAESRRVGSLAGESTTTPSWTPVAERIRRDATNDWDDSSEVERLEKSGATVVRGFGRLDGPGRVLVDGRAYHARKAVVLATGTDPAVIPVDGLAETPFWTNRDVVKVTELPASLGVIGAGVIGCELAQVFARFGVRVTLIDLADRVLANEEPESSKLLTDVLVSDGIRVMTGVEIERVDHDERGFTVHLDGESVTCDRLLVAAGRSPNLPDVGLDSVGLDPSARALDTDGRLRVLDADGSPVDRLYAVGDIIGQGPFTHTAIYAASVLVRHLTGVEGPEADFRAVPRVTYTDPEIGAVGLTEQQARDEGLEICVGTADLAESSRGVMHGAGNEGFVKVVVSDGQIVGATSAGPTGGEVLSMLTTALHARIPVATLKTMIYAYPTWHEAVRSALVDVD